MDVTGYPLFIHVLEAVADSRHIRRVFIVGDKTRLEKALEKHPSLAAKKPVICLNQWENLAANIWNGFISTLDGYVEGLEKTRPEFFNRAIFILPGDSPLITTGEIDEFFQKADMERYDYVAGLTPKESLAKYLPTENTPGITMTCFHVRDGLFRISNMHAARPFAFVNRGAILKIYNVRYQKKLRNIIRLLRELWAVKPVRSKIWMYLAMEAAMALSLWGFKGLSDRVRRLVSTEMILDGVGQILGVRAGHVVTTHGGAALDIDNDRDYDAILEMFERWRKLK
ncbi:MAG: hypothetical protein HY751_10435 [Nitrospinae bacterium]|nr:hypothetical protein [Nitrospinota bacterium]